MNELALNTVWRVVRQDVEPQQTAAFILAVLEGSLSLAKSAQDEALFRSNMRMLAAFLETLRADPRVTPHPLERKDLP